MSSSLRPLFCLMGPTAAGKTPLAIALLDFFPFEIISVDSAMIYRGMDIGTAKPDPMTLKKAPHRLINICDPAETYSAAQFCTDVVREVDAIFAQGKIPLLVGGTMMYFKALQKGLSSLPSGDARVRARLNEEGLMHGWPYLHQKLMQVDPIAANRIHPNDAQRIQRALEVFELTGKSLTAHCTLTETFLNDYSFVNIGILPMDRAFLHERIALRFKLMLEEGFLDEVRQLMARGDLNLEMPSVRSVGYRQVWQYLQGDYSFVEMQEKSIIATRQLAKRQLTWLRSWENLQVFASEDPQLIEQVVGLIQSILSGSAQVY